MLSFIPFTGARSIVGFNFCGNLVRISCGRQGGQGRVEITQTKTCNIEGLSEDQAAKAFRDALKELKVSRAIYIISADSQAVTTKNIEIPSVKEEEIQEIIELQAGRYTPYAREEIILDHVSIDTYHNSYTKVLVVIIVQDAIRRQLSILNRAGCVISKIVFASEAVACACAKLLNLAAKPSASIIISVSNKNSDFIVLFKGKTIFVRGIPLGYDNYTQDRENSTARFIEEVKKSVDAYRVEDIESAPTEIFLIGSADMIDAAKLGLGQLLGMPVRSIVLYNAVQIPKNLNADSGYISFINAASAVMSYFDTKIDLRPSELKLKMAFRERSRQVIKSGVLAMAIIVMICAMLLIKIYYRGQYLDKVSSQLATVEPQAATLEKSLTRIMIIKSFMENKNRSLEILGKLYELIPDTIYLKAVTIDVNGKIEMKGTADAMSEVFSFVTSLENSSVFQSVKAQNTASRKEGKKDVADFDLSCLLRGSPAAQAAAKTEVKASPKKASTPEPKEDTLKDTNG